MNLELPENSYDMVWACESGEHMPDKKKFVPMVKLYHIAIPQVICWHL